MPNIQADDTYVELVTFAVDGKEAQDKLLEAVLEQVRGWVRHRPGFVSSNFHASQDGKHVVNYAQWRSKADWEAFNRDGRYEGLMAAIKAADTWPESARNYSVVAAITPDAG